MSVAADGSFPPTRLANGKPSLDPIQPGYVLELIPRVAKGPGREIQVTIK